VEEVLYHVRNYKDLERSNESYLLFGFGDGGGGPTMEMLERLARMRDVDGLPRMAIRSSDEFFDRLEADAKDLNTVVGELYFELHRGTYTTQARTKRNMRKSELLLHDVELIAAAGMAIGRPAGAQKRSAGKLRSYPGEQLETLWKTVLLNQFHDILPGSSIHQVYEDAHAQLGEVIVAASHLRERAIDAVQATLGNATKTESRVLVVNTVGFARTEVVELPDGSVGALQTSASTRPLGIVSIGALGIKVESLGAITLRGREIGPVRARRSAGGFTLENDFVRAILRGDGALVSLLHKPTGREALAPDARANQFVLYDDRPMDWEAWDVDVFHLEKRADVPGASRAQLIERGPLRAAIRFTYALSPRSTLSQVVYLDATSARLDFDTVVDWHEARKFLKVEFPLNVRAQEATYDVQFGHLQRPTHFNTSYDVARFEVCAHKWADLSEPGFGVALLNDCKYGYATHGNVVRLSLLRAPKYPDPEADMGQHEFRYALLPHAGSPFESGVIESAYGFNLPLLVRSTAAKPAEISLFKVDRTNVVIETVKKAEDGDSLIVRLYEAHGARGAVMLTSDLSIRRAWRCDGLEETQARLAWHDGATLDVRPFEIVTLKLDLH
jgi:alpha-mannosidase